MATVLATALETGIFRANKPVKRRSRYQQANADPTQEKRSCKFRNSTLRSAATNTEYAKSLALSKDASTNGSRRRSRIVDGNKGSKRVKGGGRRLFRPDVEEKLVAEFTELRVKRIKVKHYCSSSAADERATSRR